MKKGHCSSPLRKKICSEPENVHRAGVILLTSHNFPNQPFDSISIGALEPNKMCITSSPLDQFVNQNSHVWNIKSFGTVVIQVDNAVSPPHQPSRVSRRQRCRSSHQKIKEREEKSASQDQCPPPPPPPPPMLNRSLRLSISRWENFPKDANAVAASPQRPHRRSSLNQEQPATAAAEMF